jgi:hypothetical protein
MFGETDDQHRQYRQTPVRDTNQDLSVVGAKVLSLDHEVQSLLYYARHENVWGLAYGPRHWTHTGLTQLSGYVPLQKSRRALGVLRTAG